MLDAKFCEDFVKIWQDSEVLVGARADVNVRSQRGMTPILHATSAGDLHTMALLLQAQADPCAPVLASSVAIPI